MTGERGLRGGNLLPMLVLGRHYTIREGISREAEQNIEIMRVEIIKNIQLYQAPPSLARPVALF